MRLLPSWRFYRVVSSSKSRDSGGGGYARSMICRSEAVTAIPDALSAVGAARFSGRRHDLGRLRRERGESGDLVAVLGLGGLGHIGIEFASKMGYGAVAIGRGRDKESSAKKLGAARYLDALDRRCRGIDQDRRRLGSSGSCPEQQSNMDLIDGLGVGGKQLVVGLRQILLPDSDWTDRCSQVDSRLAIRTRP